MKKILVTGASGFFGSRIVDYYSGRYQIYAPTSREMDITKELSVAEVFERCRPDIVLHCAAISDVGQCEREPERSWRINVDGSANIAKMSAKIHAKCIICSSDQVYFGSPAEGSHKEEDALRPVPLYGQEKLKAEQECRKIDPDCVLLRLSWMYDSRTVKDGEHSDFLRNLLQKLSSGETLSYPVYDRRGITDVHEVVENLEKTFFLAGGVYNFGAPNDRDTYRTVRSVFEDLGFDTGRLQKNEDAFRDRPRDISMCQDKVNARGIFFSPTAEGLRRVLREGNLNERNEKNE